MSNTTAIGQYSLHVIAESCFLLLYHHTTSHKYWQTYSSCPVAFWPNHTDYILIAPFPNKETLFSAQLHRFTFWISRQYFGLNIIHSIQKVMTNYCLSWMTISFSSFSNDLFRILLVFLLQVLFCIPMSTIRHAIFNLIFQILWK